MKRKVPTKLRKEVYNISTEWLEGLFQADDNAPPMKPMYSVLTNKAGKKNTVLIRSIKEKEIDPVLEFLKQTLDAEYDYYDIVGARVFAELLAIKRKRMKDEYFFLGLNNGKQIGRAHV